MPANYLSNPPENLFEVRTRLEGTMEQCVMLTGDFRVATSRFIEEIGKPMAEFVQICTNNQSVKHASWCRSKNV